MRTCFEEEEEEGGKTLYPFTLLHARISGGFSVLATLEQTPCQLKEKVKVVPVPGTKS